MVVTLSKVTDGVKGSLTQVKAPLSGPKGLHKKGS